MLEGYFTADGAATPPRAAARLSTRTSRWRRWRIAWPATWATHSTRPASTSCCVAGQARGGATSWSGPGSGCRSSNAIALSSARRCTSTAAASTRRSPRRSASTQAWRRTPAEIWLWSWAEKRTAFEIPVSDEPPLAFQRARSIVSWFTAAAGGWAPIASRRAELARTPAGHAMWSSTTLPMRSTHPRDRAFMVDPRLAAVAAPRRRARAFRRSARSATRYRRDGHALFELHPS